MVWYWFITQWCHHHHTSATAAAARPAPELDLDSPLSAAHKEILLLHSDKIVQFRIQINNSRSRFMQFSDTRPRIHSLNQFYDMIVHCDPPVAASTTFLTPKHFCTVSLTKMNANPRKTTFLPTFSSHLKSLVAGPGGRGAAGEKREVAATDQSWRQPRGAGIRLAAGATHRHTPATHLECV